MPLTSTQDCGGFPGASVPNAVFGFGRLNVGLAVATAVPPARPGRYSRRGAAARARSGDRAPEPLGTVTNSNADLASQYDSAASWLS